MKISNEQFESYITTALDELPQKFIEGLNNVAITYDDYPSAEQRQRLKLRCHQTLLGLYEGTPLTARPAADSMFSPQAMRLPDKITLFKQPLVDRSRDVAELRAEIKHTLWHEIAHYYGLDHDRIHAIEQGKIQ